MSELQKRVEHIESNEARWESRVIVTAGRQQQDTRIVWRSPHTMTGVSPLAVLKATSEQIEREQKSDLGSDANAKALVAVLQAIAELEGRKTKTADGTPIIE